MPTAIKSDIIDISSENKTEELANKISKNLKPGDVVFLYGEMGIGKTTFVKYLINELEKKNKIKLSEVTSPTFNLMNEYKINEIKLNHYDLFRVKTNEEIKNLGLFSENYDVITLIEWPQIIKNKPENLIELFFEYKNDYQQRSLQIKGLDLQ